MNGTRRQSFEEVHDGEPGGYFLTEDRSALWIKLPTGSMGRLPVKEGPDPNIAEPPTWGFEEHEDGTISVFPSIEQHEIPDHADYWHGHLTRGVWIG